MWWKSISFNRDLHYNTLTKAAGCRDVFICFHLTSIVHECVFEWVCESFAPQLTVKMPASNRLLTGARGRWWHHLWPIAGPRPTDERKDGRCEDRGMGWWKKRMARWRRGALLICVLLNSAAPVSEAGRGRKGTVMNEWIKKRRERDRGWEGKRERKDWRVHKEGAVK